MTSSQNQTAKLLFQFQFHSPCQLDSRIPAGVESVADPMTNTISQTGGAALRRITFAVELLSTSSSAPQYTIPLKTNYLNTNCLLLTTRLFSLNIKLSIKTHRMYLRCVNFLFTVSLWAFFRNYISSDSGVSERPSINVIFLNWLLVGFTNKAMRMISQFVRDILISSAQ